MSSKRRRIVRVSLVNLYLWANLPARTVLGCTSGEVFRLYSDGTATNARKAVCFFDLTGSVTGYSLTEAKSGVVLAEGRCTVRGRRRKSDLRLNALNVCAGDAAHFKARSLWIRWK